MVDPNEQNVDRSVWPIHHRWRAINMALEAGLLTLSEVDNGFQLQEVEVESEVKDTEDEPVVV